MIISYVAGTNLDSDDYNPAETKRSAYQLSLSPKLY